MARISPGAPGNFSTGGGSSTITNLVGITALGQTTSVNSLPVVLASDQTVVNTKQTILGVIDSGNSTSATLGSNATFTGTGLEVLDYTSVEITIFANVASATDGLSVQTSPDNTNWDHVHTYTVPAMSAGQGKCFQVTLTERYFRVVYTNGSSAQGTFRLQTRLNKHPATDHYHPLDYDLGLTHPAATVRSVITGETSAGGGGFVNVKVNPSGTLETNANTELPAAAALADNTSNPTVPGVGSFGHVWDGSTWDRMPGTSADGVTVNLGGNNDVSLNAGTNAIGKLSANSGVDIGDVDVTSAVITGSSTAHDAADANNPIKIGGYATNANRTRVANADRTDLIADLAGRLITNLGQVRELRKKQTTTISASTSETTIVTATASVFNDLIALIISNTSGTAARVDVRDTTAGTVLFSLYIPAGDTRGFSLPGCSIPQTTVNTNWTAQSSASVTDLRVFAIYEQNI